jgi:hypothetical protein
METLKIGTFSTLVHHFEDDDQFKSEAQPILAMYEMVCKETLRLSRFGITDDAARIESLVWQAAADTLETLLELYSVEKPEEGLDLSSIKYLANKASKTFTKGK